MDRPAGAELRLAARRAGPVRRHPLRRRRSRATCRAPGSSNRRAMLAFLPRLAEAADRQARTGNAQHRDLVVRPARASAPRCWRISSQISIAGAFGDSDARGLEKAPRSALGSASFPKRAKAVLKAAIATRGLDYVGQEVVRLSTMPRWENGKLAPRPFVLQRLRRRDAGRLEGHAGRLRPRVRQRPTRARCRWARASNPPTSGCWRTSRSPPPRCCRARRRSHIARLLGNSAEPGRGQPVLVRPLSRTRRGDASGSCAELSARAVDPEAPMNGAPESTIDGAEGPSSSPGARSTPRTASRRGRPRRRCATPTPRVRRSPSPTPPIYAASVIRERLTQQTWTLIGRLRSGLLDLPAQKRSATRRSSTASTSS